MLLNLHIRTTVVLKVSRPSLGNHLVLVNLNVKTIMYQYETLMQEAEYNL